MLYITLLMYIDVYIIFKLTLFAVDIPFHGERKTREGMSMKRKYQTNAYVFLFLFSQKNGSNDRMLSYYM